jgi:hypothetical protein
LTDRTSCNILTPTELQALIGPLYFVSPDPDTNSCEYNGEDGREATIAFYTHDNEINPKEWSSKIAGNSTRVSAPAPYNDALPDGCEALVLLKLPPDGSSVLQIDGYQGVTCDQVTTAAAAVIAHLPPP